MRNATRLTVSTFGALMGLAGLEHGLGEMLQGSTAPAGIMFPSWPDSPFFQSMAGEPAMSIIPNLLVTGMLACLVSFMYLLCATRFVQQKHAGRVLILLAITMLLVGGGIFPPILAMVIGILATRIKTAPLERRTQFASETRSIWGRMWPWSFAACLGGWLLLFPGANLLGYFFGVNNTELIVGLTTFAIGSLILTIIVGLSHDRLQTRLSA